MSAVLFVALMAVGCGGDDESAREITTVRQYVLPTYQPASVKATGSAEFDRFVRTLKRTAFSRHPQHAIRQAKELEGAEKAVGEEFCKFTFRVRANRELKYVDRPRFNADHVMRYAAYQRDPAFTARAQAALKQLDSVIKLESLDPKKIRLYRIACFK